MRPNPIRTGTLVIVQSIKSFWRGVGIQLFAQFVQALAGCLSLTGYDHHEVIDVSVRFIAVTIGIEVFRIPLVVFLPWKIRLGRIGGEQCLNHEVIRAFITAP